MTTSDSIYISSLKQATDTNPFSPSLIGRLMSAKSPAQAVCSRPPPLMNRECSDIQIHSLPSQSPLQPSCVVHFSSKG